MISGTRPRNGILVGQYISLAWKIKQVRYFKIQVNPAWLAKKLGWVCNREKYGNLISGPASNQPPETPWGLKVVQSYLIILYIWEQPLICPFHVYKMIE